MGSEERAGPMRGLSNRSRAGRSSTICSTSRILDPHHRREGIAERSNAARSNAAFDLASISLHAILFCNVRVLPCPTTACRVRIEVAHRPEGAQERLESYRASCRHRALPLVLETREHAMLAGQAMALHVGLAREVLVAIVALERQVDAHLLTNVSFAARNLRDFLSRQGRAPSHEVC